ncbi:calphotin-like [Macrobrachium rosenbergii]|uniref:calphotin-like n=1 Tax=Macrobrachium rosenbergii TaxID=79674 RepID=UPI0034D404A6
MREDWATDYIHRAASFPEPPLQVAPELAPQPQPYSVPLKSERQPLEPLIIPPPKLSERASTEEPVRPPKHPDRDEAREQKKPKKKRESVIQLAKRLEESIIPMSPDEVPGGIRMFPSPKQPSTPVRETPTPTRESASGQATSASEDEGLPGFKTERFPDLEPFPFVIEERPRRERPRSMPPPAPKKFVPGSYTDSEYESDMELDQRLNLKKLKFEAPVDYKPEPLLKELTKPLIPKPQPVSAAVPEPHPPKPRPLSLGQESFLPFAVSQPPVFDGSMRPDVLKKEEEEVKEAPKSVTPKKKSKLVEKFLEASGVTEEEKVVRVTSKKTKKEVIPPPKPIPLGGSLVPPTGTAPVVPVLEKPIPQPPPVQQPIPDTSKVLMERPKSEPPKTEKPKAKEIKTERPPPKPMVDIDTRQGIKPSKIAKLLPSPESEMGPSVKHASRTSYTESKTQMSSVSYQKTESTLTSTHIQTSEGSVVIPKPEPAPIFSHIPQVPVYPEVTVPPCIQEREPTPVQILQPEPAPVYVQQPEPDPVSIAEPIPVCIPEPTPVSVIEPEPVCVLEPEPEPALIYSPEPESVVHIPEPELTPVYVPDVQEIPTCIPEPQSEPVYAAESEPVCALEPEPEPAPVLIPEPEPVYMTVPESFVVTEKEPEPSHPVPEPVISPPITLEPIPRHAPSPSPAPGFRPVRAPTPKRGQTPAKSTPAPPPPFDMVPIKLELPVIPTVMSKPQPEPVVDTEPEVKPVAEPTKTEEKKQTKSSFKPVKVPAGGKMLPVWPPLVHEEPPKINLKTRAHSLERPPVTEAPQVPVRSHEAPPSIYWSSNVTVQEKRKTWPQQIPQAQTITSASRYETISKSSTEESKISKFSSKSLIKKEVKTESSVAGPTLAPAKQSPKLHSPIVSPVFAKQVVSPVASPILMKQVPSPVVSPALSKQEVPGIATSPVVSPSVPRQVISDVITSPVLSPPLKLPDPPDLSIAAMFDIKPKPKENAAVYLPIHKVPKIEPKKGKDASGKSTVPLKEGTVISTVIPMPPLEPFPFAVEKDKGKRPRGRAPSMPRRFVPGSFTESEYESDLESAPSPVSRLYMSDSETFGYKPLNIRMKRGRSMQPRVPSPPKPSTLGLPEPFDETLSYANAIFPELETGKQSKMSQSKHIIQTVKSLAKQITPESKLGAQRVTAKPLTPQAPIVPPPAIPKVAPVTVQMPIFAAVPAAEFMPSPDLVQKSFMQTEESGSSTVQITQTLAQTEKGVKNIMKKFEGSGPAPLPQKVFVPNQPPTAIAQSSNVTSAVVSAKTAPVTPGMDGMEDSTSSGSLKKKPASPKSRKKTESTQMTALEQEESGYVADTEGTLPRRHAKTTQSSTSSSSFSKSESFMSASFSKSESRSFSSTEFGQVPTSVFTSGGGLAPNGNFPPTSFTIPTASASTVGQTSHFSSSFKSTESKSSQVRKFKFPMAPLSACWP